LTRRLITGEEHLLHCTKEAKENAEKAVHVCVSSHSLLVMVTCWVDTAHFVLSAEKKRRKNLQEFA